MGNILGTSTRHDQNIALWKVEKNNITLLCHCELERISGIKHHDIPFYSMEDFSNFVNELLIEYAIERKDIVKIIGMDLEGMSSNNQIAYHSLCHLYASAGMDSEIFYNGKILALSLDAEPDVLCENNARNKYYYAGAYINQGHTDYFSINSPGVLWTEAVEELKMPEGTLMALSSASNSKAYYSYELPISIKRKEDNLIARKYVKILCQDIMKFRTEDVGKKFNYFDSKFTVYENKVSMIMKVIQDWSIKLVDQSIDTAIKKYSIKPEETYIALSGGYALNCPTNTHIMHKYNFKSQLMIPCVNDSGQSIGSGLFYFYQNIPKVNFKFNSAYLGSNCMGYEQRFEQFIESKVPGFTYFVDDIKNGPLLWFNGRAESGPRALGNRSLLADPRNNQSKKFLNNIKQREWWRPVAPVILREKLEEWFERSFESKYMLNNFSIKNEKKGIVPAILHLDNTCRVQTVGDENKMLQEVIQIFNKETDVPILCNTSLNDKNEPIIDTIDQAFNFALRKGIEIMYINGVRYKLWRHNQYNGHHPLKRRDELFVRYQKQENLCKELNPYGITDKEYDIYINSGILKKYDFMCETDVNKFKKMTKRLFLLYDN